MRLHVFNEQLENIGIGFERYDVAVRLKLFEKYHGQADVRASIDDRWRVGFGSKVVDAGFKDLLVGVKKAFSVGEPERRSEQLGLAYLK